MLLSKLFFLCTLLDEPDARVAVRDAWDRLALHIEVGRGEGGLERKDMFRPLASCNLAVDTIGVIKIVGLRNVSAMVDQSPPIT